MGMLSRSLARTQATYRKNTGNRLNIPVRAARTNNAASVAIHRLQTNSLNIPLVRSKFAHSNTKKGKARNLSLLHVLVLCGVMREFDRIPQTRRNPSEGWAAPASRHPPKEPRWPQEPVLTSSPSEGWAAPENRHPPEG